MIFALFAIFVAVFTYGSEFVLIKFIGEYVPEPLIGAILFTEVALLYALTLFAMRWGAVAAGRPRPVFVRGGRTYLLILVIGVVAYCLNITWLLGVQRTAVVNASALQRLDVLFTLLLALFLFHEKVHVREVVSGAIMLAGAVCLSGLYRMRLEGSLGDYLMVVHAFFLALNGFIIKRALRDAHPLAIACGNCAVNGPIMAATCWVWGVTWNDVMSIPLHVWGLLALCGCFTYLFFAGYYYGLRRLRVWVARLLFLGIPVVSAVEAWIFLGERPHGLQVLGAALVCLGAAGIITAHAISARRNGSSAAGAA